MAVHRQLRSTARNIQELEVRTCRCMLTDQNNGQARTTARVPTTHHLSLLLRSDLDLASVLTEINSAAAKAGSVLADACNPMFLHSASVSILIARESQLK